MKAQIVAGAIAVFTLYRKPKQVARYSLSELEKDRAMRRIPYCAYCGWLMFLALAVAGCAKSDLEKAEEKLAKLERELGRKRASLSGLKSRIGSAQDERLAKAMQQKEIEYTEEIKALTLEIEQLKQRIEELSAKSLLYFESPQQAVAKIKVMLDNKSWSTLSRHYDLTGSGIDRATLASGEYFYTTERPAVAHPGGFWRYKHPFAPAFDFHHVEETSEPSTVKVVVSIEIDQGAGSPVQRGFQSFKMRKSTNGYQILPEKGTGAAEEPSRAVNRTTMNK